MYGYLKYKGYWIDIDGGDRVTIARGLGHR